MSMLAALELAERRRQEKEAAEQARRALQEGAEATHRTRTEMDAAKPVAAPTALPGPVAEPVPEPMVETATTPPEPVLEPAPKPTVETVYAPPEPPTREDSRAHAHAPAQLMQELCHSHSRDPEKSSISESSIRKSDNPIPPPTAEELEIMDEIAHRLARPGNSYAWDLMQQFLKARVGPARSIQLRPRCWQMRRAWLQLAEKNGGKVPFRLPR